ncbi:sensor histidine kinase [Arthrobacter sp. NQ7]|uniref:sensor histidine kinase n=1 Tax=Arthrobacter sp. NQ7 TaxID=3032303 RepID=UPI00240F8BD6|nr:sensor histidine kinase [Arthrobacter sp. NQ7]MDJ0458643.1 sensor histidine kinase [Arthrobacter sp. NQ7]
MKEGEEPVSFASRIARNERLRGGAVSTLLLVLMFVPVYLRQGQPNFPGTALVVFTFLAWLPLTVRKRWPKAVLLTAVLVETLHLAVLPYNTIDGPTPNSVAAYQPVPLATMVAVYAFASRSRQAVGWAAGVASGVVLLLVALAFQPLTLLATDMMTVNLVLVATAAGVYAAHRQFRAVRQKRERKEEIRRNVVEERMRIARELHDVLAHNLTLVNAQAGVAAYLIHTNPEAAASAMKNISGHTRAALDEVRATVGLLRDSDGDAARRGGQSGDETLMPTPGLADLDALMTGYRRVGNTVEIVSHGAEQALSPVADLGAYRIIQEAMTNAAKHSPGGSLRVELDWKPRRLTIHVVNGAPSQAPRTQRAAGGGHGLIGMRERALAAGGTFRAGPTEAGGFDVEASFPAEAHPAAPPATHAPTEGNAR